MSFVKQCSCNKNKSRRVARLPALLFVSFALLGIDVSLTGQSVPNQPSPLPEYAKAFRQREHPDSPSSGSLLMETVDPTVVTWFSNELESSDETRRQEIIVLLVDVDLHGDPLARGVEVLRNPAILSLLVGASLDKADIGRDSAMAALRLWGTQADLKAHAERFCDVTLASPSDEGFLLLAKAKPKDCLPALETLARSQEWRHDRPAKILLAALGDGPAEDEFLASAANAESASDAASLERALQNLALIGTVRSLTAVAERLRSPLTRITPTGFVQSVRLDALRGLSYNYPGSQDFSPAYVGNDARYPYAEAFCVRTFGVRY